MKINPITIQEQPLRQTRAKNDNSRNLAHFSTKQVSPTSLDFLNRNYNQISTSFKGVQNRTLDMVKQIPLSDRLASLFQNFRTGDLILTGTNLKDARNSMNSAVGLVKNVFKKVFFVEDDKIGGSLGFIKNTTGDTEIINLNDFDIELKTGNKSYPLKAKDNFYVIDGDTISVNGNELEIKSNPKTDLSAYRKIFAKAFDFTKEVEPEITKVNKKMLSTLINETKKHSSKVTFADVGGQDKLIEELKRSIIYPIQYPEGYENFEVNHGFILYGPPGTGKTHIARALANEIDANFISINGLEFESKWVGESEENWRNLFAEAKEKQPTIIFLDEFDAVARKRENNIDEHGNKVVDQILTLMTDIDNEGDNIFVIGATNNFNALDSAITRSGRFSKHLEVALPDKNGVQKIFNIHTKNKPLSEDLNIEELTQKIYDLKPSGADIRYIVNEAHTLGYERAGIFEKMGNKSLKDSDIKDFKINQEDFDKAIEVFANNRNIKTRKPIGYNKH